LKQTPVEAPLVARKENRRRMRHALWTENKNEEHFGYDPEMKS
jgi:hypothetical protein